MNKILLIFSFLFLCLHQTAFAGDGAGTMPGKFEAYGQLAEMDQLGFLNASGFETLEHFFARFETLEDLVADDFDLTYLSVKDGVYILDLPNGVVFKMAHRDFRATYQFVENISYQNPSFIRPAQLFFELVELLEIPQ